MATLTYFVRASKNSEFATIRAKLSITRNKYFYASTNIAIPLLAWNKTRQTLKQNTDGGNTASKFNYADSTLSVESAQVIVRQLEDIKQTIYTSFSLLTQTPPNNWLQDTINEYFASISGLNTSTQEKEPETLNQYIARCIEEMKTGKRLSKKNTVYSAGTIHNMISFQSEFNKFQKARRKEYNFNDITIDFYNEFVAWFNKKKYSPNTTGKHIKSLKYIISEAREENLHTNMEPQRKAFKALTAEADTVYLTRAEVSALESLPDDVLTTEQRICRDVFLCGIYTAQRYSDYHRIAPENIITLDNGRKAVSLYQQKTQAKVIIPVSPQLDELLRKYNYILPKTNRKIMNEAIKVVCRKAGITQKVEHKANKGAMIVTDHIEKCLLITTHTARRTGATLMYLEGLDTLSIMKITGHKTEKEFKKYIRVNEEENAVLLSNSEYFNRPVMKVR